MAASLISFLAILNPFALCLCLVQVIQDLDMAQFLKVFGRASIIAFFVFAVFALWGDMLLAEVLMVRPDAMRIFGGLVFLIIAHSYVTKGHRAIEMLRGTPDELPSAIAVPFMVGAGTITQAIFLGRHHAHTEALLILALGMVITMAIATVFKLVEGAMRGKHQRSFERYINILARMNGLVIGAISIEMIFGGVQGLWSAAPAA